MSCTHDYKRMVIGISDKVWSQCTVCGWLEDTGKVVVSAARIAALEAALRSVLDAEWMVTCDWTSRDEREKVLGPAQALLPDLPTQSENEAAK